jgi:hypothetical protein
VPGAQGPHHPHSCGCARGPVGFAELVKRRPPPFPRKQKRKKKKKKQNSPRQQGNLRRGRRQVIIVVQVLAYFRRESRAWRFHLMLWAPHPSMCRRVKLLPLVVPAAGAQGISAHPSALGLSSGRCWCKTSGSETLRHGARAAWMLLRSFAHASTGATPASAVD